MGSTSTVGTHISYLYGCAMYYHQKKLTQIPKIAMIERKHIFEGSSFLVSISQISRVYECMCYADLHGENLSKPREFGSRIAPGK